MSQPDRGCNMKRIVLIIFCMAFIWGCGGSRESKGRTLTLGAYTVPKEVYQNKIIPAFKKYWLAKTGEVVQVLESYTASGAQSRAIAAGFEADVAALSLERDIERLEQEGLITHNWKNRKFNGFPTRSIVVICYRPGNPKQVKGWDDLTRDDVEVILPSPKTSGGAMWFINAIYGSALKRTEAGFQAKDRTRARTFLKKVQQRVKVMDKSGRASVTTFENGIGDVLITYENEALLRRKQGKEFPFLRPKATILIENPVALIDRHVDKHNNRDLAEAFIDFLFINECQRAFAQYGFRPVNELVASELSLEFPRPGQLFDIQYLGGWDRVYTDIYGPAGVWTKIVEEIARQL